MPKVASLVLAAALALGAQSAVAEETATPASAEEAAKVSEAIAKVGCKAEEIEKESADLFEVDDARCEIGQYDIKVNGEYKITVMTSDE